MTQSQCELCAQANPSPYEVPQNTETSFSNTVSICDTCRQQIEHPDTLDANHWHALTDSIWTENPAVKILAWRILNKLSSERWAQDLLDQLYMEDDLLRWAQAGGLQESAGSAASPDDAPSAQTRDSNGAVLTAGDSVTLIKDLEVKGAGFTAKRGTLVKGISLTDDPELIEGRVNGVQIVLKTCFLRKVNTEPTSKR